MFEMNQWLINDFPREKINFNTFTYQQKNIEFSFLRYPKEVFFLLLLHSTAQSCRVDFPHFPPAFFFIEKKIFRFLPKLPPVELYKTNQFAI